MQKGNVSIVYPVGTQKICLVVDDQDIMISKESLESVIDFMVEWLKKYCLDYSLCH